MNSPKDTTDIADRLLRRLRPLVSTPVQLDQLTSELGVGHDEIQTSIAKIKEWGYGISISGTEITLETCPDLLNDIEIPHFLKSNEIGRTIHTFMVVQSTNDIATKLAENGCPHGTIVVADQQTAGRGRRDRQWHSIGGVGIYVSIVLRPDIAPAKTPPMTIMTALALADTLAAHCPGQTQIKWPNDVLLGGRKVAGILAQLSADGDRVNHIVVGVGINVNHVGSDFPPELSSLVTSLGIATGKKYHRSKILAEFLGRLETEYGRYIVEGLGPCRDRLRQYSSLIGRHIQLASGRRIIDAEVLDIDSDGRLVIQTDEGTKAVTSGEVTIVKK